jgi:hypothetical protein
VKCGFMRDMVTIQDIQVEKTIPHSAVLAFLYVLLAAGVPYTLRVGGAAAAEAAGR